MVMVEGECSSSISGLLEEVVLVDVMVTKGLFCGCKGDV